MLADPELFELVHRSSMDPCRGYCIVPLQRAPIHDVEDLPILIFNIYQDEGSDYFVIISSLFIFQWWYLIGRWTS